jgi:general secretion pathway protein G
MIIVPSASPQKINRRPTLRARAGFTLLEVLMAIALLALLVGVVLTNVEGLFSGGQEKVAKIFVQETARTGMATFRLDTGNYPSGSQGLAALVQKPAGEEDWRGPYLDAIPDDPWGNPYQYQFPGTRSNKGYDVWSYGPDGTNGTEDDIGNW